VSHSASGRTTRRTAVRGSDIMSIGKTRKKGSQKILPRQSKFAQGILEGM